MKRGTPEHPKMTRLANALKIEVAHAVGLMECLWHFAAKFTPSGNIGKWKDADIAIGAKWNGDPQTFVAALVASDWVDECATHRLVIHDWHEHADDAVRKHLTRNGKGFVSGHVQTESADGSLPEPSHSHCQSLASAKPEGSGERSANAAPPTATILRWQKSTGWEGVSDDDRQAWAAAYPACDLDRELAKMHAWLVANPTKVKKNWRAFVVRWLAKEQDRGGTNKHNSVPANSPARIQATPGKYARVGQTASHVGHAPPDTGQAA